MSNLLQLLLNQLLNLSTILLALVTVSCLDESYFCRPQRRDFFLDGFWFPGKLGNLATWQASRDEDDRPAGATLGVGPVVVILNSWQAIFQAGSANTWPDMVLMWGFEDVRHLGVISIREGQANKPLFSRCGFENKVQGTHGGFIAHTHSVRVPRELFFKQQRPKRGNKV